MSCIQKVPHPCIPLYLNKLSLCCYKGPAGFPGKPGPPGPAGEEYHLFIQSEELW